MRKDALKPFRVAVPEDRLADLRRRLDATRWPIEPATPPWRYGPPLAYLHGVVEHWRERFDWRAQERRINGFPNYTVDVDGHAIHVIVEKGSGPDPRPLLLTHGWPGSVVEFLDVIAPLAHPERFGGDVRDAFTVVAPSLPGYGFSDAPSAPISPRDVGRLWHLLMTRELGFPRYVAQGGDFGSIVTSWLAYDHPEPIDAIHLNLVAFDPLPDDGDLHADEIAWVEASRRRRDPEAGYRTQQGTRPHTLAYGLTDSPAGLAAWILEKFHGWTVPGEDRAPPFDLDHLLANVMLYWLAGPGPASWMYVALTEQPARRLPSGERVTVPTGILLCPRDVSVPPPNRLIERSYNMVKRVDLPTGGHFVALEQGEVFVREVRAFFRDVPR